MSEDIGDRSYYEREGVKYPRVTNVLKVLHKPGLDRWRGWKGNQEADAISKEGSRIGREFHKIAAKIACGEHLDRFWQCPPEYEFMEKAYINWMHEHVEEIVQVETTYYSDQHECTPDCPAPCPEEPLYGGTLDLLAVLRGDTLPSIVDLKTSNQYSDDWPLQLSAYRRMVRRSGIEVARRLVIRIPKQGVVEPEVFDFSKEPGSDDEDEAAWIHTLGLWRWFQGGKKRKKAALWTTA